MTNLGKYDEIFMETLSVEASQLNEELVYQSVSSWDSIGHMSLITVIEDTFNIMFETDDIIDFSSYPKGKEIIQKYGVEL